MVHVAGILTKGIHGLSYSYSILYQKQEEKSREKPGTNIFSIVTVIALFIYRCGCSFILGVCIAVVGPRGLRMASSSQPCYYRALALESKEED